MKHRYTGISGIRGHPLFIPFPKFKLCEYCGKPIKYMSKPEQFLHGKHEDKECYPKYEYKYKRMLLRQFMRLFKGTNRATILAFLEACNHEYDLRPDKEDPNFYPETLKNLRHFIWIRKKAKEKDEEERAINKKIKEKLKDDI